MRYLRENAVWMVLAMLLLPFCGACAHKNEEIVGKYIHEDGSDNVSIDVEPDGAFKRTIGDRVIGEGKWRLIKHSFFDTGIEFDLGSDASEYRLTRRHGAACWEVRRDLDYWCKAQK